MTSTTATRGQILSWTLFDFANTGYNVIIITLVFQSFYQTVIGGDDADWGLTISTSMLLTALIGPLLGSIADAANSKKRFLALFTGACVIGTMSLYFTGPGTLLMASILLVIANVGFEGGIVFYDAFLPEIVPERRYARVSGYGFAMGYVGSFIALVVVFVLLDGWGRVDGGRLSFLYAALHFAVFSLPLFLFVPERGVRRPLHASMIGVGYRRLRETLTHIKRYESVKRFLIAFFVYNDSIITVIAFAASFGINALKMSEQDMVIFLMVVQGAALAGSLLFGAITNRIGARQSILTTLGLWVSVAIACYFVESINAFYVVGVVAGIALGSSQSSSRTMMALLTPEDRKAEFFGFYDGFFGKASAVVGPMVFGFVSVATNTRVAMLMLGGFMVIGMLLMLRVPDVRPSDSAAAV